jgi:hypothetical protein
LTTAFRLLFISGAAWLALVFVITDTARHSRDYVRVRLIARAVDGNGAVAAHVDIESVVLAASPTRAPVSGNIGAGGDR